MIRSFSAGSYPTAGGSFSIDGAYRGALEARARGEGSPEAVLEARDEVAALVVAEQARAFVDVVTDGLVGWEGLFSHLAGRVEGVESGDAGRWCEAAAPEPRPVVTGAIRRRAPFLVRDFAAASAVGAATLQAVIPGPVSFARFAADRAGAGVPKLAAAVAEALAAEAADLAAAGCAFFRLEEPLLCRHPEDAALVAATASAIFRAAGPGATTVLATSFGDLASLGDAAAGLPGTHLGLDLVHGPANASVVRRLPPAKGLALGVFDATRAEAEDADEALALLEPLRPALEGRDLLVGPQAGLGGLDRDAAFEKLLHARYLAETLRSFRR